MINKIWYNSGSDKPDYWFGKYRRGTLVHQQKHRTSVLSNTKIPIIHITSHYGDFRNKRHCTIDYCNEISKLYKKKIWELESFWFVTIKCYAAWVFHEKDTKWFFPQWITIQINFQVRGWYPVNCIKSWNFKWISVDNFHLFGTISLIGYSCICKKSS